MLVTIYFATNRQPFTDASTNAIAGFGPDLGPTGGLDVRYGEAQVDIGADADSCRLVPGSLKVAEERLIFPQGGQPLLGSNTIFDAIREDMQKTARPTITFIHGFSNSFADSIERAAWIQYFYGINANMFVFSWPSSASPTGVPLPFSDYVHDRGTAAASGVAVARTMRRLCDYVDALSADQHCQQSIHLLCHSMGNYVLRNAVQAMMQLPSPPSTNPADSRVAAVIPMSAAAPDPAILRRIFDKIILAAADEDADAFDDAKKLKFLPRIGQTITVYYSANDWVLNTLSAGTKFNGPRLGGDGPDNMNSISDKVTAVDVTDVTSLAQDPEEHQYYRIIPMVRDDIVQVLRGNPQNKVTNRVLVSDGRYRIEIPKTAKKAAKSTDLRAARLPRQRAANDWPK